MESDLTVLLNLTANLRLLPQPKMHIAKSKRMQELNVYSRDFLGRGTWRRRWHHSVKLPVLGALGAGVWEGILVRRCIGRVLSAEGEWKKDEEDKSKQGCGFSRDLVSDWSHRRPWNVNCTTELVPSFILEGRHSLPGEDVSMWRGDVWVMSANTPASGGRCSIS